MMCVNVYPVPESDPPLLCEKTVLRVHIITLLPCAVVYNDNYLERNFTHTVQVQCPSYWCQGSLFPIILQIQTKKQGGQQWCLLSGINFYGLYLSAPTLALSILFANFLHFSSVPRFSIFHYSFDGLAPLLLVPSSCAAIGHWLKFIFWFYVFDATSFCVNLPGMYNPFE